MIATAPAAGSSGAAATTTIAVDFSEALDPAFVDPASAIAVRVATGTGRAGRVARHRRAVRHPHAPHVDRGGALPLGGRACSSP